MLGRQRDADHCGRQLAAQTVGHALDIAKHQAHLGRRPTDRLAAAQSDRHASPARSIHLYRQLGERLGLPLGLDALFRRVVGNTAPVEGPRRVASPPRRGDRVAVERPRGLKGGRHRVVQVVGTERRRLLHDHEGEHEQQVALDHVDERTRRVVVARATLEREPLVVDDLDALDVLGIPDRVEDPIGEPEAEQIDDRRLAEEVIDAVDARLGCESR